MESAEEHKITTEDFSAFMPSAMMHQLNDEVSSTVLSNGIEVISDSISDTYITRNPNGTVSIMHCDHFGCKTKEDVERLSHECFINMLKTLDEDELEEVRKINHVDAISDLFEFKPSKGNDL